MAEDVGALTDPQLRERLTALGQDVPPITQSTRKTLEKRLLKLMGSTPSGKTSVVSHAPNKPIPVSHPREVASATLETARVAGAKRTPSPPIAPLARNVKSNAPVARGLTARTGAGFSSDEDDEFVSSARNVEQKNPRVSDANATGGTPVRGYLNGRLFGSSKSGPSASTDVSSSGSKSSGLGRWFGGGRQEPPNTSTPKDQRIGHARFQDSFGALTPISDVDGGLRSRRSVLGRAPLASFGPLVGEDISDSPATKKRGLFSRLMGGVDPIHLTPQPNSRERLHVRHSPPRPRPLQFLNTSKDEGNWFSRNSTALLLSVFALFFLGAGGMYLRMKWTSSELDSSILRFRLEGASSADTLYQCVNDGSQEAVAESGSRCYTAEDILRALDMSAALSKTLARMKGDQICEGYGQTRMDVGQARSHAIQAVPNTDSRDFTRAVDLIVANPHWGIRALDSYEKAASTKEDVRFLESEFATKNFVCRLKEAVATMLFKILLVGLGVAALAGILAYIFHFFKRREQRQEQVYELVNRIIGAVHNNYEEAKKEGRLQTSSVVSHVRELFVPHGPERKYLLSVWNEAVDYIHTHESRISLDVQQINGEDFEVWNWLPIGHSSNPTAVDQNEVDSSSSSFKTSSTTPLVNGSGRETQKTRARLWGGGPTPARSIMPESIIAATSCLKVRGMFDGKNENQNDVGRWSTEITDAILEKCYSIARILDIAVEPTSEEGVVYVKLFSNEDARNAYMALHGQYFDGRSVTVKFLKLERYHHRFPAALDKLTTMSPSKLSKRS